MLLSVKEYAAKDGVSTSTVQRRLSKGELKGRRIGRSWFVELDPFEDDVDLSGEDSWMQNKEDTATDKNEASSGGLQNWMGGDPGNQTVQELVRFSAKALNSYLMMSDRLIASKEESQSELKQELTHTKQRLAELESYVKMLEGLLFSDRGHGPQLSTTAPPRQLSAATTTTESATKQVPRQERRHQPKVHDLSEVFDAYNA